MSKRPRLKFEELQFANPAVKQQARYFHELAKGFAGQGWAGWAAQGYKDARRTFDPEYVASWPPDYRAGVTYIKSILPYRGFKLTLRGNHRR